MSRHKSLFAISLAAALAVCSHALAQNPAAQSPPASGAAQKATGQSPKYKVGHAPTAEEVKAWDISIPPDGSGLPPGEGTAEEGAKVYQARCQECHGADAKGGDEAALVGGHDTLATAKPLKTSTGYWPYATTLFDYTRRAMPFKNPGMLTDNQVYAVVAYLLALDGIIEKDAVMNAETLPKVKMPNRDGFVRDPRPGASGKDSKKK
jgi:cytochrome c